MYLAMNPGGTTAGQQPQGQPFQGLTNQNGQWGIQGQHGGMQQLGPNQQNQLQNFLNGSRGIGGGQPGQPFQGGGVHAFPPPLAGGGGAPFQPPGAPPSGPFWGGPMPYPGGQPMSPPEMPHQGFTPGQGPVNPGGQQMTGTAQGQLGGYLGQLQQIMGAKPPMPGQMPLGQVLTSWPLPAGGMPQMDGSPMAAGPQPVMRPRPMPRPMPAIGGAPGASAPPPGAGAMTKPMPGSPGAAPAPAPSAPSVRPDATAKARGVIGARKQRNP